MMSSKPRHALGDAHGKGPRSQEHKTTILSSDRDGDDMINLDNSEQSGLHFVTFSHPTQTRNIHTRSEIRSHVTRRQHRLHRERLASFALKRPIRSITGGSDSQQVFDDHVNISERSNTTSAQARSTTAARGPAVASCISRSPRPQLVLAPPRLDITFLPAELRGFALGALEYYETVIAVPNDFICGPGRRNALRTEWPFFMMSDRVSLLSMALNVSPFYARAAHGVSSHSDLSEVLYLRGLVIHAINQALSSSATISDQLIFAVLGFAHYEYLSNNEAACWVHLDGFYRMVCLRGGLQTLGLDGFLERAAIFMDFHLAYVTGRQPYFDTYSLPSTQLRPRLNLKAFFGQAKGL